MFLERFVNCFSHTEWQQPVLNVDNLPTSRPAWYNFCIYVRRYYNILGPNRSIPAWSVSIMPVNHLIPVSVTLTLSQGHNNSGEQNPHGSISRKFFSSDQGNICFWKLKLKSQDPSSFSGSLLLVNEHVDKQISCSLLPVNQNYWYWSEHVEIIGTVVSTSKLLVLVSWHFETFGTVVSTSKLLVL